MKAFIIGAAGNVGRRVVKQLTALNLPPIAMSRHADQAKELKELGAMAVEGDLLKLSIESLANKMKGADAVLFSAGAGGKGMELTNAIDGTGLELSVRAAELANIKHFVLVSVFPDALRSNSPSEGFENYISVKKQSDIFLVNSSLDWVIVRPGTLTNEPGTGNVTADFAVNYGEISRDDVATSIVEILQKPTFKHTILELTQGDTPIKQAISKLSKA